MLPATQIFDVMIFFIGTLCFLRGVDRRLLIFFVLSLSYVVCSFFYSFYFTDTHPLDFLQAYKAFIYVCIVASCFEKRIFEVRALYVFVWVMLLCFIFKYSYSLVFDFTERMGSRPGVFDENNFELMFFVLMVLLFSVFNAPKFNYFTLAVFILVFISGSRSALLANCVVLAFIYFKKFDLKFVISLVFFPLILLVVFNVFIARLGGGSLDDIDRVWFFNLFLNEVYNWGFSDFLFGSDRLTPLSSDVCKALFFYEKLFSYKENGDCYSVIFHSYFLRAVFDHGFLGLSFIISFYWYLLKFFGFSSRVTLAFILAVSMSALSVSSFNSVYVALASVVFINVYRTKDSYDLR
ncbi:hypothetical protein WH43_10955 [Rheinheimera sp. KL1]|uniref:hypothetical protein n=1 Tax=Rheinheimera sp. KL1 TaxID=1635005 RepID=UPI0006C57A0D|nr:hypothetical protein [Rheinheimera sp. KL1]KOO58272.1 hypothetical protein WH43_10955 [Rheinheimera sp. KL1]